VVREYYPAFSLAERGTFRVDEYQGGFHPDIFRPRIGSLELFLSARDRPKPPFPPHALFPDQSLTYRRAVHLDILDVSVGYPFPSYQSFPARRTNVVLVSLT